MIGFVARALGVDPAAHRLLHKTFWDLSRRGGSALIAKRGDVRKSSMTAVFITYGILGLFSAVSALFGASHDRVATQVCGTALVLLSIAIVADFAAVVIAPGDDEVLFHLPISSRTYLAARMTVAATHATQMALAFGAGPALIAGASFHAPAFALALYAGVVLAGWFALLLSFVIYRAALSLLGGERLRTTLAYLPGIISLVAALAPQFLISPQRDPTTPVATWTSLGTWSVFFPPAWFSAPASLVAGDVSPSMIVRALLGAASIPIGAWILLRALGGSFLSDLIRLVGAKDAGPVSKTAALVRPPPSRLVRALLGLDSPEACAGYLLAVGAFRSRESKTRTFPLLLLPVALVVLGAVRPSSSGMSSPVFGILFLGAGAGTLLAILPYHEHRDAGFIHEALPIRHYGRYYLGVVRALLFRLVAPWMLLLLAVAITLDPSPLGIGLALHSATGALLTVPVYARSEDDPPFSRAFTPGDQSGRIGVYLLNMFGLMGVAVIGLILQHFAPIGFWFTPPIFLGALILWMGAIGRRLDLHPPAFLSGGERVGRGAPIPRPARA